MIRDFLFVPGSLTVKVGQEFTVTNEDRAPHTATAVDDSFDTKNLTKGQSVRLSIDKPGTYAFICDLHQYMKGTLTVE